MEVKSRRAAHTEATRRGLIAAGRRLFGSRGYGAVSVEAVAQRARVTTGAVYHHFGDKRDLFRAVYEQVDAELADRVAKEGGVHADPWDRLIQGFEVFMEACRDEETRRIIFIDGAAVLGWEEWRQIDTRFGLGLLAQGLGSAMDAGVLKRRSTEPLAHLLYGAINEAGLALARADDFEASRAEMRQLVADLLSGLRA